LVKTDQLKILILSHRVPFPQNGGYAIVVANTIKGLVNSGHDVSLIALNAKRHNYESHLPDEDLMGKITYWAYDIDTTVTVFDVAVNLFKKTSFNVDRFYDPEFDKLLIADLKAHQYDVVQLEGLFVSLYIETVRKYSKAKLVYRAHNIENQIWWRLSLQKIDPFKKSYLQMHGRRIKRYEQRQLNKVDAIAVFTPQDKKTLLEYGIQVPIEVLPIGLRLEKYEPDMSKTEFPSLFFLGSLDWLPNREGMEWFLDTFINELTNGDLPVKLYVAGNDIPERFDDYEALGKVFIQGEVDDALEFVNSKSIMIVPLVSGGGMRVKIIEGMAMQKCIISTSLGAEGINFTNAHDILIANNREEFMVAMQKCIRDEEFCMELGRNARRLAEKEHDINLVTKHLVEFFEECCKR
jgi:glycosyltransferase involved in cell wall biosynthesis